MKIAVIIVRLLMGLLFIFGSVTYFFDLMKPPELEGNVKVFMDGMLATGFMMPLIKGTEFVCGAAFLVGRYVALASILIAPIIVNIFLFHLFLDASGMPVAIFLVLANSFLAYSNWGKYQPLLSAK